jgi:hypothetical protein
MLMLEVIILIISILIVLLAVKQIKYINLKMQNDKPMYFMLLLYFIIVSLTLILIVGK